MERTRGSMTILANKLPFLYPCQIIETMMIVNGLHICHGSAPPSPFFPSSFPFPHPRDHQVDLSAVPNARAQMHKYPNTNTQILKHKYTNTKTQVHKYQNTNYKYKPLPAPTRPPGGSECKLQKSIILRNRFGVFDNLGSRVFVSFCKKTSCLFFNNDC